MTIARNTRNSNSDNPARRAFSGGAAHPYIVQKHLELSAHHVVVNDDFYLTTIGHRSIGLGLAGDRICVIVDNNRVQKFSRAALADSDRILDYLGLADDPHSRCFERMCADFAEAHAIDATGATQRLADERRTFETAPGDGGCSDQDLVKPLPVETYRMNLLGFSSAKNWAAFDETLATIRGIADRLNGSGQPYRDLIVWAEKWAASSKAHAAALKNQPRRGSIGSMPAAWRHR
jgi:hypothetical protein